MLYRQTCSFVLTCLCLAVALPPGQSLGQALTDGKIRNSDLSDNFEDTSWQFNYSGAGGTSANGKWYGSFRGAPETLVTTASPAGGLSGQSRSLRIGTVDNGNDSTPTQEDFVYQLYNTQTSAGFPQRSDQPLFTTQVYLPSMANFAATGTSFQSFGHRIEAVTSTSGVYYPSIWVNYSSTFSRPFFSVRLGNGIAPDQSLASPVIGTSGGWWTLGIGFDENGVGHYYASEGTDLLTTSDEFWDTTQFQAGQGPTMDSLNYHFYSIGYPSGPQSSLEYLVDDSSVYVIPEPGTALLGVCLGTMILRRKRQSGGTAR